MVACLMSSDCLAGCRGGCRPLLRIGRVVTAPFRAVRARRIRYGRPVFAPRAVRSYGSCANGQCSIEPR